MVIVLLMLAQTGEVLKLNILSLRYVLREMEAILSELEGY
jgi:hypothetical protein